MSDRSGSATRMATAALLGAFAAGWAAAAQDNERIERCLTLSFAPLDDNVPACTTLIEDPSGLDPQTLADLLAARADALQFALTYHGDHEISPVALLADALADLDRAVEIDPRHHARRGMSCFSCPGSTKPPQASPPPLRPTGRRRPPGWKAALRRWRRPAT